MSGKLKFGLSPLSRIIAVLPETRMLWFIPSTFVLVPCRGSSLFCPLFAPKPGIDETVGQSYQR